MQSLRPSLPISPGLVPVVSVPASSCLPRPTLPPHRVPQPLPLEEVSGLVKPSPAYLQTSVAMMTHQAVQQQSASRCSSVFLRRQHSQKE